MREIIDKVKVLMEMPYLMSGEIDFGLGNEDYNKFRASELMASDKTIIEDNTTSLLAWTGTRDDGEIFLYDKSDHILDYYVKFEATEHPVLGQAVTQVALFRRSGGSYPGITKRVFFDFLLKTYDGIVSDSSQSEAGMRFWLDRMSEATQMGLVVGLRTPDGDKVFDPRSATFNSWIKGLDAWGKTGNYTKKLFFIVKG